MLEVALANNIPHQIDIIDGGMIDGAIVYTQTWKVFSQEF